jgi:uncharacterized membrane-anchored protein YhcB (DUF1043 family)
VSGVKKIKVSFILGMIAAYMPRRLMSSHLRQKMQHVIASKQKEFNEFKKEYSEVSLGEVNVG